jgi:hypothetical protein
MANESERRAMSKGAVDLTLNEAELEQVRSDREGLEWLHEFLTEEGALETVQPGGAPSATPISGEAFDLDLYPRTAWSSRFRQLPLERRAHESEPPLSVARKHQALVHTAFRPS